MRAHLLLAFLGMGLATYLTRAPLLILLARRPLPRWLARYFAALPVALLTALALPLVLMADGRLVPPWAPEVPGALIVALVARRSGRLGLAVLGGVLVVTLLRALGA